MIIISFCFFLLVFVLIGALSTLKNKHNSLDYLLAGHSIKPWLVALSAVATNNSGYMFIGMIGYSYTVGFSSVWLMVGWIFGDFLASLIVHKRLRVKTEKTKVLSYTGVLSKWIGCDYRYLRMLGGFITLLFLGTYAAAQLSAGSKALYVLFNWNYSVGAILGALIVLIYCFAGGIRASIWTDAAQSFVMITAMGLMTWTTLEQVGGLSKFYQQLNQVSPTYTSLYPDSSKSLTGMGLFILGWLFAGFAVVGQPHIMVRFMAMDTPKHLGRVRLYYYSWYALFYSLTIMVGLSARLLLPETSAFDAELAMPTLAKNTLAEPLVGLVLAGLFAATMSTADSQILSCTAAISRDFTKRHKISYWQTKLATVFVVAIALSIALSGNKSVFSLVLIAWSALGSSFSPLLTVYSLGGKPSERCCIAMMLVGLITMLAWRHLALNKYIYEAAPGIIAGFIPYLISLISEAIHKKNTT